MSSPSEARQLYPNSLRALYGDIDDDYLNVAHGSRDEQHAKKEIQFFFPNCEDFFVIKFVFPIVILIIALK